MNVNAMLVTSLIQSPLLVMHAVLNVKLVLDLWSQTVLLATAMLMHPVVVVAYVYVQPTITIILNGSVFHAIILVTIAVALLQTTV